MTFSTQLSSLNHKVTAVPLLGDKPEHWQQACFAMGCFWGAERRFWELEGVKCTAVGYTGGTKDHPTYQEVCTGTTGHAEAVLLWFDPKEVSYLDLLAVFWQEHDPTQGMRQGNDVGSQYRSAIYVMNDSQKEAAMASKQVYEQALKGVGRDSITTEITPAARFYYAEPVHQQYLVTHPYGYCGLQSTGVALDQTRVMGALKG